MPKTSRHPWKSFLFCVVGATILWICSSLNEVYTTKISYPVCFVTEQSQKVVAQDLPAQVTLEVTGSGWRLLRYLLRLNVLPLEIPAALVSSEECNSEQLSIFFDKKIQALAVHSASFDEAFPVHTLSPQ